MTEDRGGAETRRRNKRNDILMMLVDDSFFVCIQLVLCILASNSFIYIMILCILASNSTSRTSTIPTREYAYYELVEYV